MSLTSYTDVELSLTSYTHAFVVKLVETDWKQQYQNSGNVI